MLRCRRSTLLQRIGALLRTRPATLGDVDRIYYLCQLAHDELTPDASFSEDKCLGSILRVITEGFMVVAEEGKIVGIMAGGLTSHMFSDELVAMDALVYVLPEFRGSTACVRLLNDYVDWAKAEGVKPYNTFVSVIGKFEEVGNVFSDYGFKKAGYLMNL